MDNEGMDSHRGNLNHLKSERSLLSVSSKNDETVARIAGLLLSSNYNSFDDILQILCEKNDVERSFLFEFFRGESSLQRTHEWCQPELSCLYDRVLLNDNNGFQFWIDKLRSDGALIVSDLSQIETVPSESLDYIKSLGLTSFLMVPVILSDQTIGGILLLSNKADNYQWSDDFISTCNSVSEMIGTIWNHKYAFDELSMYRDNLEEMVRDRTRELEYANTKLHEEILAREKVNRQLDKYRDHLEMMVKERTVALVNSNEKLQNEIAERNAADKAMREAEDKYRLIVENTHDLIYSVKLDGTILFINSQISRYGYKPDDVLGHYINEYIHPVDIENVITEIDRVVKTGETVPVELRVISRDGSFCEVEAMTVPVYNGNEVVQCIGVIRDISERIVTQKALQESEERFKQLSDATFEAITIHDGTETLEVNQACLDLFGYKREEIMGKDPLLMAIPEYREIVKEKIQSGDNQPYEAIGLRSDGSTFYGEVRGKVTEFQGRKVRVTAIRDITEHKVADLALRESEKRYRILAENVKDVIWMLDLNMKYTYISPSIERIRGFTVDEVINTFAHQHLAPASLEYALKVFEEEIALEGRPDSDPNRVRVLELEVLCKDGSSIWTEHSVSILRDKNGKATGFLGVSRDIDDRRTTELKLRENENKFRTLFENATDFILIVDPDHDHGCDCVIDCNEATCYSTGFKRNEILGQQAIWLIGDRDKEKARYLFNRIIGEKKSPIIAELTFNKKDGTELDIELISSIILLDGKEFIFAIGRDITKRKQIEAALRESKLKYQEMFNGVMEGISIVDEHEKIVFCNPAFAAIFDAKSQEDLIGKSLLDYLNDENKVQVLTETGKRKSGVHSRYELDLITASGNKKTILCNISPRYDDRGLYRGAFGTTLDVTETKRLQEFSSRAQRLETAGRIASQVAHDFNNLLGPMTAYPELIKEDLPKGHPAIKYLDDIVSSATRMADINQQLLTLGRRGHYNLEIMNLNEVVELVLEQVFLLEKNIAIHKMLDQDLENINGGKSQIYRAISNIVLNAKDALPDGGEVFIKTENVRISDFLGKFTKIPGGEYVKLSISDTGSGIPTEILPRIFEPFFTSKVSDKQRGSGLGLSVVHAVVEDHDAFIDWDSAPDQGASFFIYFPVSSNSISEVTGMHIVGGDENILVIDDDTLQRGVTRNLLEKLGYSVESVSSGEKGIEYLKSNARDLIILDMIMPDGMDGTETYKNILKFKPDQKAIVVSGFADSEKVESVLKLGVNTFLRKPLTLRALALAVRKEFDNNSK